MGKAFIFFLLLVGTLSSNAQEPHDKEGKVQEAIIAAFQEHMSQCDLDVVAISDFNKKTEFWSICELKNSRVLRIESHVNDTYFQEIYFEKNGELIYAKETENYIPKNHYTQLTWNCYFYIEKGKLVTMMSHGHGKTEDEEWNPEIIFEMYQKRINELKKLRQ